jgi:hypothetical protein
MAVLVKNNAFSTLASGITNSATSISLAVGTGARFPAISGGDYFYATLIDTSNNLEIVKVTARSSDTLTVLRGQDNTTARTYSTGDRIELRLTAGLIEDIRDGITPGDGTVTTDKIADNAVTAGKLAAAVNPIGKHTIWVPATAMVARITDGAAAGTVETTTNRVMLKTLNFDPTTPKFAQFAIQMPKGWNEGALVAQFVWSHPATTTDFDVVWALEAMALGDNEAADTAFGTAQQVTDAGGTTDNVYITSETTNITVGSTPGAENWVVFQVKRVANDVADTMEVDARLHGVKIHYTIDAARDN